jgi:hypothetical protein
VWTVTKMGSGHIAIVAEQPILVFWKTLFFQYFIHRPAAGAGPLPMLVPTSVDVVKRQKFRRVFSTPRTLALSTVGFDELLADGCSFVCRPALRTAVRGLTRSQALPAIQTERPHPDSPHTHYLSFFPFIFFLNLSNFPNLSPFSIFSFFIGLSPPRLS